MLPVELEEVHVGMPVKLLFEETDYSGQGFGMYLLILIVLRSIVSPKNLTE